MSADPLKITVPGKLPTGTELLSTTQGIDKIRTLAAVHELGAKLEFEMDLFTTYARAHMGKRFLYSQIFGSPGEAIGLLFICAPQLRNELAFVFRTQTKTDSDIDQNMEILERLVERMGIAYFHKVCGNPDLNIRVLSDFEIQEPLLLSQARN
jgi:hypothetical protein